MVQPNFRYNEFIDNLREIYNEINREIEKYENFITFASKLKHVVNTDRYEAKLSNLRKFI